MKKRVITLLGAILGMFSILVVIAVWGIAIVADMIEEDMYM